MILKMNKVSAAIFILVLFFISGAHAEEAERPVIGSYRLEIGKQSAYSTYLSPFSYTGTGWALSGQWSKVIPRNPEHMAMHFEGKVTYGSLLNPAHSARELDFHANVQWGLEWQKRFSEGWMIGVGGNVGIYGGILYLPRNGNNPASAQFATGISAQGYASKRFTAGRLPILISDRLNLPLMGAFFMQDYGESYYEIYLGNHKGLAHFGWPGNRFGIDNLLMVSLDFGKTAMEVGYRFSMQREHANRLSIRLMNNAFVIGIIPGGLGLKRAHKSAINPLY